MEKPKLSIIIPTYNSAKTIREALDSVIEQTFSDKEVIIIDNLSNDDTNKIVLKYIKTYPFIKLFSRKDKGIYDGMNKGIKIACGVWVYFLGSDDKFYDKNVLTRVFSEKDIEKYDVFYGNVLFKKSGVLYDGKFNAQKLLRKNICHQGIFVKKNLFQRLGKFETKYKALADWVFNMQWFNDRKIRKKYINDTIAIYNEDGYAFNNRDIEFSANWENLVRKHFSVLDRFIYKNRENWFIARIMELRGLTK